MYPLIRCFCGRSLGDITDLYLALRAECYAEMFGGEEYVDPNLIPLCDEDIAVDIFPMLGITLSCCKSHLMSQVQIKEYY